MPTLCLKHISGEFYAWACSACGREFDKGAGGLAAARPVLSEAAFREHFSEDHPGEPVNIPLS